MLAFSKTNNEDTILDHIEMALRGGYRKARDFIPTEEFKRNPRDVEAVVLDHIRGLLAPLYPDVAFAKSIAEAFARPSAWLVDPIDGSMNERRQDWRLASTIALVEHGEVTVAGIYDISGGRIFTASVEDGRYVTSDDGTRSWLMVTGGSSKEVEMRKPRSLKIMDVICGPLATFRSPCDDPLDFIAAAFIAQTAGCVVRNADGGFWDPTSSDIIVASDRIAYKRIRDGKST